MTNKDFLLWLKGFADSIGDKERPTTAQWGTLLSKLQTVEDEKPEWLTNPNTWLVQPEPQYPSYPIIYTIPGSICNVVNTTSNITYNNKIPTTLT